RREVLRSRATRGAARRGHDVPRPPQLFEEVGRPLVFVDLHPAVPDLLDPMRVRARGRDLAELRGKLGGGAIRARLSPRVVRLDDVDAIGEGDAGLAETVRSVAVERMGDTRGGAHLSTELHGLLRSTV